MAASSVLRLVTAIAALAGVSTAHAGAGSRPLPQQPAAVVRHQQLLGAAPPPHAAAAPPAPKPTKAPADPIPAATRAYWMREAMALLNATSPCPFAPFAALVVNHTADPTGSLGDLVCSGVNELQPSGNPTLHGEVVAINHCVSVLRGPAYNLSATAALAAFANLTLYTTAEPCPMCAGAIRWAGFSECVYGTGLFGLVDAGWQQMIISAKEIFTRSSKGFGPKINLVSDVLSNETDALFAWQYNATAPCPAGCVRENVTGLCEPVPAPAAGLASGLMWRVERVRH